MEEALLQKLRESAQANDISGDWPAKDLDALARVGAMRWVNQLKPLPLHMEYYFIASASLATGLILTQRDSAVAIIRDSDNVELRDELMPKLESNESFTTVGIAQLTTSRQGRLPAVRATSTNDGYLLDGIIPWCTGAAKADVIVAGAALDDGRQILFALPTNSPGVDVQPPLPLVALRATWTSEIHLKNTPSPTAKSFAGPWKTCFPAGKIPSPRARLFSRWATARTPCISSPPTIHPARERCTIVSNHSCKSPSNRCSIFPSPIRPRPCSARPRQLQQARSTHHALDRRALQRLCAARDSSRATARARGDVSTGLVVSGSGDRLHCRPAGRDVNVPQGGRYSLDVYVRRHDLFLDFQPLVSDFNWLESRRQCLHSECDDVRLRTSCAHPSAEKNQNHQYIWFPSPFRRVRSPAAQ